MTASTTSHADSLSRLFRPRSIAVVGASDDPSTMGSRPLRYLSGAGYEGAVFPVNPRKGQVAGFTGSLSELKVGSVDLALVLVRAERVLGALQECERLRVGSVVVGSAGFSEAGEDGASIERQISEFARRTGIRVLGPNCLGLVQGESGTYATFASLDQETVLAQPGSGLAIVSQSGALASYTVDMLNRRGIPCRDWVSTGNEADVDAAACVDFYATAPGINGILLYIEGAKDFARLGRALETARRAGKTVAVLKAGRTSAGAQAVASHTASIAGEDVLFDALLRQCAALRLRDFGEVMAFAELVSGARLPAGPRTALLSLSGGIGALMVDECVEAGLDLPPVPAEDQSRLKQLVPFASVDNPMDPTGAVASDPELLRSFLDALAGIPDLDSLVIFPGPALVEERYGAPIIDSVVSLAGRSDLSIVVSGAPEDYATTRLRDAGVPLCSDPVAAIRMLAAIQAAHRWGPASTASCGADERVALSEELLAQAQQEQSSGLVPEPVTKRIIEAFGVRVPGRFPAATADQAEDVLSSRPGRYVMKANAPGVAHKTEAGLVRADIASPAEARRAFDAVQLSLKDLGFGTESVFLEEQVSGTEVLVSARFDASFGPVLTVGSGGFFAEVEQDVAVWLGTPTQAQFRRGLESLRVWPRLSGYRGRPPADTDALYELCRDAMAVLDEPSLSMRELELNPVAVMTDGLGAVALDAVAWLAPSTKGTMLDG